MLLSLFSAALIFSQSHDVVSEKYSVASAPGAAEDVPSEWLSLKTDAFTIYYAPDVNLKNVARKLNKRGLFYGSYYDSRSTASTPELVSRRIDLILKKVEEILDMYPLRMNAKIKIFSDRDDLSDEFEKIFRSSGDFKAFYIHRYRTIYVSEETISDSVLSHEMAHMVVDNYFSVIPPEKVREMLARYVDEHLED